MWGYEHENFGDVLSACDFSQAIIEVFNIMRLIKADAPTKKETNVLGFVYDNLPMDLVLTKDERTLLSSVTQISHLFDIADFEEDDQFVRCFSVDLGTGRIERSLVQHSIHSIIARKAPYCSVVFSRDASAVSLSVAYHKASDIKSVFLSDWYELYSAELDDLLVIIGTEILSLKSAADFASDFIHLTARDYYIHQLSYEYLRYELNVDESFIVQIVEKYGDDYVTDAFIEASNIKVDTTDDIDFDLIEYELDQIDFEESEKTDDDELEDEYSRVPIINDNDVGILAEEIPKGVLADPVLLLRWLNEHSAEYASEAEALDTAIIDLINAENIDYVDHRDKGGRLWIFGGYELSEFARKCKEIGIEFHFKEGGGVATDGFDAWWYR
jgi:hypothetical protein